MTEMNWQATIAGRRGKPTVVIFGPDEGPGNYYVCAGHRNPNHPGGFERGKTLHRADDYPEALEEAECRAGLRR